MDNDLISRKALKEQFDHLEMVTNNSSIVEQAEYKMLMTCISLIDNAPTVEAYTLLQVKELVEFNQKLIDELEERPRGSWNILQKDDNGVHEIECPFCKYSKGGRFASVEVTFHELPPFCEACGADMRKGEAE